MAISSYTIKNVKGLKNGYKIDYGAGTVNIYTDECNFIPQKGQKIVFDGTSITIAGKRIR